MKGINTRKYNTNIRQAETDRTVSQTHYLVTQYKENLAKIEHGSQIQIHSSHC